MLARCMPILFGEIGCAPNGVARWIAVLGAQGKRRQIMDYKIVELPAFRFAGVKARVPLQFEGENNAITELAQSITKGQRAEMHRLVKKAPNPVPHEMLNVSWDSDTNFQREEGFLTHMISVATTAPQEEVAENLLTLEVASGTWAAFPNDGLFPQVMQQTTANIYAEWLGSVPYELDGFRMFSFSKIREDGSAYSEIWVPVRRE